MMGINVLRLPKNNDIKYKLKRVHLVQGLVAVVAG